MDESVLKSERELDQFERGLGLPLVGEDEISTEGWRLLQLPPGQLKKFSAIECGEAAFVLGQYAFRIQQACNREQARVTWAEQAIRRTIGGKTGNYRGVSFEERKMQAVADNDAAAAMDVIRVRAQLRLDRISFLSAKAEGMARSLMSLKNTKRGNDE